MVLGRREQGGAAFAGGDPHERVRPDAVTTDWQAWHRDYADPDSPLSRRLELVRQEIGRWLDERPGRALTAVSACAGQGHDLIGVLAGRDDAARVRATLVEYDPGNVAAARAAAAGLDTVTVLRADAGKLASYVGAVPADLVLMVGVFGNVPDFDVRRTVHALPQLCAPDATVVWTRSRRAPDRTPALRRWLREAGFQERAFHAPHDVLFSVGVHRLTGSPRPLDPAGELFRFHPGGPAQTSPRAEPSTDSAPLDTGVLHPYSK